jgi:hypothetical protein
MMPMKLYGLMTGDNLSPEQAEMAVSLISQRRGLFANVDARFHHLYLIVKVAPMGFDRFMAEMQRVIAALKLAKVFHFGVGWEICKFDILHPGGCPNRETTCTGLHVLGCSDLGSSQELAERARTICRAQLAFEEERHARNPVDPGFRYPSKITTIEEYRAHQGGWIEYCDQIAARPVVPRRAVVVKDSPYVAAVSEAPDVFIVEGGVIEHAETIYAAVRQITEHFCNRYADPLTRAHAMQGLAAWQATYDHGSATGEYLDFINFMHALTPLQEKMMAANYEQLCELADIRYQAQARYREAAAAAEEAAAEDSSSNCEEGGVPSMFASAGVAEELAELVARAALGGPGTPDSPPLKPKD